MAGPVNQSVAWHRADVDARADAALPRPDVWLPVYFTSRSNGLIDTRVLPKFSTHMHNLINGLDMHFTVVVATCSDQIEEDG